MLGPLPSSMTCLFAAHNKLDSLHDFQAASLKVLAVDSNQLLGFADASPITGLQVLRCATFTCNQDVLQDT